jgi:hypothetical protein
MAIDYTVSATIPVTRPCHRSADNTSFRIAVLEIIEYASRLSFVSLSLAGRVLSAGDFTGVLQCVYGLPAALRRHSQQGPARGMQVRVRCPKDGLQDWPLA